MKRATGDGAAPEFGHKALQGVRHLVGGLRALLDGGGLFFGFAVTVLGRLQRGTDLVAGRQNRLVKIPKELFERFNFEIAFRPALEEVAELS